MGKKVDTDSDAFKGGVKDEREGTSDHSPRWDILGHIASNFDPSAKEQMEEDIENYDAGKEVGKSTKE